MTPHNKIRLWLCLFTWLTICIYAHPGTMNPAFLTLSIVRDGTFQIDRYANIFWDQSYRDGHYYYGRHPGVCLLATPVGAIVNWVYEHHLPDSLKDQLRNHINAHYAEADVEGLRKASRHVDLLEPLLVSWAMIVTISAASAGLIAVVFYDLLTLYHLPESDKVLLAFATVFGTLTGVFATTSAGHATCGLFALCCFYLLCRHRHMELNRRDIFVAGVTLGLVGMMEYFSAIIVVILGVYALCVLRPKDWWLFGTGAILALFPLPVYHTICFGHPWLTPFSFRPFTEGMPGSAATQTASALAFPTWHTTVTTLFSPKYGYFFFMPITLVGITYGIRSLLKRSSRRTETVACLVIVAAYLVALAALNPNRQLQTFGPRYLVLTTPFAVFLAALALRDKFMPRLLVLGAIILSSAICFIGVQFPQPMDALERSTNPLVDVYWPMIHEHVFYSTLVDHIGHICHLGNFVVLTLNLAIVAGLFAAWIYLHQYAKKLDSHLSAQKPPA